MKKPLRHFFNRAAFTLIELLMVVAIIAILLSIGIPKFNSMMIKAADGSTKGNLATLRSAISIYFGDNGSSDYPYDDLSCLTFGMKYLPAIPPAKMQPFHAPAMAAIPEVITTDSGLWSYNNDPTDPAWGSTHVGCTHQNSTGVVWSSY